MDSLAKMADREPRSPRSGVQGARPPGASANIRPDHARQTPMKTRKEAGIVAEKPAETPSPHGLRWLLVLAALPLLGVVGAFGIAPDTATDAVERQRVITAVDLAPVPLQPDTEELQFWREERIQRGDTIGTLLSRLQLDDAGAIAYLAGNRDLRALRQLVPGKTVKVVMDTSGRLLEMHYRGDAAWLGIVRSDDGFDSGEEPRLTEQRTLLKSGVIQSSLFAATDAAGIPDAIATQLADVFSSDVDFHRDLRKGDRFSVVFEMPYANGDPAGAGRILAAEFVNQGRTLQALYFEDGTSRGGYYTPDGRNVRKTFLRSPLEFSRVTSGFSNSRFHPVLQTWRAHKGIDYGAPVGTRIRATADGVIDFAGRRNGYGNTIVVRHAGGFSTLYGHLSGVATGIRDGVRVAQGDLIGFVGMTGLATGPHVHYEFLVHGVHVDPMRNAPQPGPSITSSMRLAFDASAAARLATIGLLRSRNLAALE
jgi:murein DD-endopeptidase MepM/ murein hydrolase activator NlpD